MNTASRMVHTSAQRGASPTIPESVARSMGTVIKIMTQPRRRLKHDPTGFLSQGMLRSPRIAVVSRYSAGLAGASALQS
jgi:hypothetical protein